MAVLDIACMLICVHVELRGDDCVSSLDGVLAKTEQSNMPALIRQIEIFVDFFSSYFFDDNNKYGCILF